jgi:hypothetical protein
MQIIEMYTGDDGKTHTRDLTPEDLAEMADRIVGPVTVPGPLERQARPPGFFADWHPFPTPNTSLGQIMVMCTSVSEYETEDGWRRLMPGDAVIVTDFTGKGHRFAVTGLENRIALVAKVKVD